MNDIMITNENGVYVVTCFQSRHIETNINYQPIRFEFKSAIEFIKFLKNASNYRIDILRIKAIMPPYYYFKCPCMGEYSFTHIHDTPTRAMFCLYCGLRVTAEEFMDPSLRLINYEAIKAYIEYKWVLINDRNSLYYKY